MKRWRLIFTLIYNFMLPSLLLNCVGVVILQLVNQYHVSMQSVSWLEAFKDITILVASFLLASYIPRVGYKRTMVIGALLELIACLIMATYPSFVTARLFFVITGVSFALIKISVYSSVSLVTSNENEHASFLSILEGMFMTGILAGFWLFGIFMHRGDWTSVFWVMGALAVGSLLLLLVTPMDESRLQKSIKSAHGKETGFREMLRLIKMNVVWLFLILAFVYVFVEQGVTTWLPTYDDHVLHITSAASVEIASLFSAGLVVGRIGGGIIIKFIHWRKVIFFNVLAAIGVLFYAIYLSGLIPTHVDHQLSNWLQFPMAAYLIPVVGLLIGPIYPTLCSSILSAQHERSQSAMTALIMIFSALGGTIGSRIVGTLFGIFGGLTAIKVPITPLIILLILIFPYYSRLWKFKISNDEEC